MDKFIKPNSAYERLWAEYNTYGKLIVAVDFDDTLYDFHKDGSSYNQVKQLVRDLKSIGCYIIIWTGNRDLKLISNYLTEHFVPFDSINDPDTIRGKVLGENHPRKIYANVYIDDRAGLKQVYDDLSKLVSNVKSKTFYRVCNEDSYQGLWYKSSGEFAGLIHDKFSFCKNFDLVMDFDEELVGWLSAVDRLDDLWNWFTKEDVLELQKHGWYIFEYESNDYKFYDKFQHLVINKETSKPIKRIIIDNVQ